MYDRDQKPQFKSIPFCLLIAAFSLAFTTRPALAAEEGRSAAKEKSASVNATPPGFPDRITTLDGKTYEKVTLEKVDPDGLLVVFAPVEGGSGTAKLKFRNLPAGLRERYGYDPARASDYETARARGEAMWSAENALWTEQRRAAQAEEAAWERQLRAQAELRLAAEAEQARADAARNMEEPAYYYPGWLWPGTYYNATPHHPRPASHHNHIPQRMPAVGSTSSPISPTMGPMRPLGK
jgi:hypothetical protein